MTSMIKLKKYVITKKEKKYMIYISILRVRDKYFCKEKSEKSYSLQMILFCKNIRFAIVIGWQ